MPRKVSVIGEWLGNMRGNFEPGEEAMRAKRRRRAAEWTAILSASLAIVLFFWLLSVLTVMFAIAGALAALILGAAMIYWIGASYRVSFGKK